eukprot:TRINITY_DN7158_c0_g1_i2.p1 TRINITY_DN7158_c0_g1~~TRINITY_DN7158_c0_g1_i2.p1  ORF type:complete len:395 (+),score=32.13 TRINITY_DN7158_c0_g1_i2:237-1421(+)
MYDWSEPPRQENGLQCRCLGVAVLPLGLMAILSGIVMLGVTEHHAVVVWRRGKDARKEVVRNEDLEPRGGDLDKLVAVNNAVVKSKGVPLPTKPGTYVVSYTQTQEEFDPDTGRWSLKARHSRTTPLSVGRSRTWTINCNDFAPNTCPILNEEYTMYFTQQITPTLRYHYQYVPRPTTVSFAARQAPADILLPWTSPIDHSKMFLYAADPSPDSDIFNDLTTSPGSVFMYPLRVCGWLLVWLGMHLVLSWLIVMAESPGFLRSYFSCLTRISTAMLFVYGNAAASMIAIIIIGLTWAVVQPSLAIPLTFCLIVIIGIMQRTCTRHGSYTQAPIAEAFDDSHTDCISVSTDIESICTDDRRNIRPPSPPLRRAGDFAMPGSKDVGDLSVSSGLGL